MERTLPVKIGAIAQSHYKENFRNSGFDGTKWKTTWRQQHGSGAASSYGPLLSKRKNLYNSITRTTGKGTVTISTNVEYAAIHNEGGTLHPKVTPKNEEVRLGEILRGIRHKEGHDGGARRRPQLPTKMRRNG
jgi:phage gpG-like protein